MKLLCELVENVELIKEAKADGKGQNYFIEGVFLQSNIPNRNHRFYPTSVMESAVSNYTTKFINDNRGYGELGHPAGPTINPERISHRIVSLTKEGNNWIGKAQVSSTPYGNIVKGLIDDGGKLGVSSRGLGSLKENKQGIMEVQSDFFISTAGDIVVDPSAPQAFVNGIMEGADWIIDAAGNWTSAQNTLDRITEETKNISVHQLEENALEYFSRFVKSLSKI